MQFHKAQSKNAKIKVTIEAKGVMVVLLDCGVLVKHLLIMVLFSGSGVLAQLLLLPLTNAIISGSFSGYLFTAPDEPDSNRMRKDRAQQWCQNNGSTLMEIYNSSFQEYIASFVNDNNGQRLGRISMLTNGIRNTSSPSWQWVNGKDFSKYARSFSKNKS